MENRTRTLGFDRDGGDWYADIPEYIEECGDRADLQMVAGADHFLDILAQGENRVMVKFSTEHFEGAQLLKCWGYEAGGGNYTFNGTLHQVEYSLSLWLCEVTEYVLGSIPDYIYFKQVG